jgi:hypothetical protein
MEHLKRFEDYEYNNEDMILEEWKLPGYQEAVRRKLSFLKSMDLSELEPTVKYQLEIKELWRKIMKKLYTKDTANEFIEIVDNSNVQKLDNTLDMIKKIKASVEDKKSIGHLIYSDKGDKFHYEKPVMP